LRGGAIAVPSIAIAGGVAKIDPAQIDYNAEVKLGSIVSFDDTLTPTQHGYEGGWTFLSTENFKWTLSITSSMYASSCAVKLQINSDAIKIQRDDNTVTIVIPENLINTWNAQYSVIYQFTTDQYNLIKPSVESYYSWWNIGSAKDADGANYYPGIYYMLQGSGAAGHGARCLTATTVPSTIHPSNDTDGSVIWTYEAVSFTSPQSNCYNKWIKTSN